MSYPTDRRAMLLSAGAVLLTASAGRSDVASADIRGSVEFEGGARIPEGLLDIYFEDPAIEDPERRRLAETEARSDGKSERIPFSLSLPSNAVSPTSRIVAWLERSDGWLIARGSAGLDADTPVDVTLNAAVY